MPLLAGAVGFSPAAAGTPRPYALPRYWARVRGWVLSRAMESGGGQFLECAFNIDTSSTMKEFRPFYAPHWVFVDRRGISRTDVPAEPSIRGFRYFFAGTTLISVT